MRRTKRTPVQEKAYQNYLAELENAAHVRRTPEATQQQFETAKLEVEDSLRHMYDTVSLKPGETVRSAVKRVFPELD